MEFDESKVYSIASRKTPKEGTLGYFADSMASLRMAVRQNDVYAYGRLAHVEPDNTVYRFVRQDNSNFLLFYPDGEKEPAPFHDKMSFILALTAHGGYVKGQYTEDVFTPVKVTDKGVLLTHSNEDSSKIFTQFHTYENLYGDYMFLDGSPIQEVIYGV